MTVPYPPESRLLRAKRVLAKEPFSPCYFMGVPLDEFTAPEICKIAQISMTASDFYHFTDEKDTRGVYGPPEDDNGIVLPGVASSYANAPANPFKKGDTAIVIDEDSIFRGKIIQVEAVVKRRVVATWETSRDLGSLYQVSFDYESLCRSQDDNDCVVKSEN